MISPEILRKYPFFGLLSDAELRAIAMIAEEETIDAGVTLFQTGNPADALYFLINGQVDLYYTASPETSDQVEEGILVDNVNPGEPFSISAVIEPHILSSGAYVAQPSQIIKIDAHALRALFEINRHMAYLLTCQATKVAIERLCATRVQLAAALA